MKAIIFGVGKYFQRYKEYVDLNKVIAFIDNSPEKQGKTVDGIKILSPEKGVLLEFDYIYIFSAFYNDIFRQLTELGVSAEKILGMDQVDRIKEKKNVIRYGSTHDTFTKRTKIVLFSHNMSLSGAPWALFFFAKELKKNGYYVECASGEDGELRKNYLQEGIPVLIDNSIGVSTLDSLEWSYSADLFVVNTFLLNHLLKREKAEIPVIWWIHEPPALCRSIFDIQKINRENLSVYAVSDVAEKAIHTSIPQLLVHRLECGIPDVKVGWGRQIDSDKVSIIDIGQINYIKGQDLLVAALSGINFEILKRCKVSFIGGYGEKEVFFVEKIRNVIDEKNLNETIECVGIYDHIQMQEAYRMADIVVIPSRQETLSLVAMEALMYGKTCIISDVCGITNYLQDKEDSIFFTAGNIDSLRQALVFALENPDLRREIGKKARNKYLRYFTLDMFGKRVMQIMQGFT